MISQIVHSSIQPMKPFACLGAPPTVHSIYSVNKYYTK